MNFSETNIDFGSSPRAALECLGDKTVRLHINGQSGSAAVMHGCSATGFKFPAFIIWQGAPNGRINQEKRENNYPHSNSTYCVQPKGMMAWVENVMAGYSQQNNNLLYLLHSQLSVHLHNNSLYHLTKYGNEVGYIAEGFSSASSHG
jgi:hypothetical protein